MSDVMHKVVVQKWEVSERGTGCEYDSCTLHLSEHDRVEFVADFIMKLPNVAPESYIYACGAAYMGEVDAITFKAIAASKNGLRQYGLAPLIAGPIVFVQR